MIHFGCILNPTTLDIVLSSIGKIVDQNTRKSDNDVLRFNWSDS